MKPKILIAGLLMISFYLQTLAHGDDDHSEKKPGTSSMKYFSSEAISDKYELLLKYGELTAGKESVLKLFVSNAITNRAIDSATIEIKIAGLPGTSLKWNRVDTGIYDIKGIFPANQAYDLQFTVNSAIGPDLLQLSKIEIGKKFETPLDVPHQHWYDNPVLWGVVGLVLGLLAMYFLMRKRSKRITTAVVVLMCLTPLAESTSSFAHGDDDHGDKKTATGGLSNTFIVEKESQFLFDIITQQAGSGMFSESTQLLGTVIAAPGGKAVIQTPQTGKIISLLVRPGQMVSQGQVLVSIEQQIDAGTQVNMISQRNSLNAEVKAAKVQYDRLKSIEDIAAKKDVTEAKARYEAATQNLKLFNSNIGKNLGSTKMVTLTAPISGIVGNFNYAIGAVINSGETLFDITNLNKVYVETQVFNESRDNATFIAMTNTDTTTYQLKKLSVAQTVNAGNQAQKMLLEIINPGGKFKIGENVTVLRVSDQKQMQLTVPTSAITDVNGKPAVFIKDKAEQFSVSFVQKGASNPFQTVILKGAEDGEKIVTENVYQIKMIYLSQ